MTASLPQDRFLRKDANQNDATKSAVYTAVNPAPKRGDDTLRKAGRPNGAEEDSGAKNVLTGTVITSCFIQTSALPSRAELQGNDLTFFDDTTESAGEVTGDTSRLIFTHGSAKFGEKIVQGFIWEKRASTHDTYDNVLSLYALPPKDEKMNYLFFGFSGDGTQFNTNAQQFAINHDSGPVSQDAGNGLFAISGAIDRTIPTGLNFAVVWNDIVHVAGDGYSVYIAGSGTGIVIIDSDLTLTGDFNFSGTFSPAAISVPGAVTAGTVVTGASLALAAGPTWTSGVGSPEGVVTAPVGSLYSNRSGGASTTLYVKTSGAGNTGWTAK